MRKHHYRTPTVTQDVTSTTIDLNENIKLVLQKMELKKIKKNTFKYKIVRTNSECSNSNCKELSFEKIASGDFNTTATNIKAILNNLKTNSENPLNNFHIRENPSNQKIREVRSKSTLAKLCLELPPIKPKANRLKLFAESQRNANQEKNFRTVGDCYRNEKMDKNIHSELKRNMMTIFKRYNFSTRDIEDELMKTDVLFKRINMFLTPEKVTSIWLLKYWLKTNNEQFEEKLKKLHDDVERESEPKQGNSRSRCASIVHTQVSSNSPKRNIPTKKLRKIKKHQLGIIKPIKVPKAIIDEATKSLPNKGKDLLHVTKGQQKTVPRQIVREDSKEIGTSVNVTRQVSKNVEQVETEESKKKKAELEKKKQTMRELAKEAVNNMQKDLMGDSEENEKSPCKFFIIIRNSKKCERIQRSCYNHFPSR